MNVYRISPEDFIAGRTMEVVRAYRERERVRAVTEILQRWEAELSAGAFPRSPDELAEDIVRALDDL